MLRSQLRNRINVHTTIVGERLNCRVVVYLHFIWVGGVVEVEVSSGVTDVVEPTDGDFVTHIQGTLDDDACCCFFQPSLSFTRKDEIKWLKNHFG